MLDLSLNSGIKGLGIGVIIFKGIGDGSQFAPTDAAIATLPLKNSIVPTKGIIIPLFSRSTIGTVIDFEGSLNECKIDEARFEGARRVENICTDSEIYATETVTVLNGMDYIFSFSGTGSVVFSGAFTGTLAGTGNDREEVKETASTTALTITVTGEVLQAQLEKVSGTQVAASEYVSVGKEIIPYHGAGVDGVEYFIRDREGTRISEIVLQGCLNEPERSNLFIQSETAATQNITVISGMDYTIHFLSGDGNIVLSGAGSGTVTSGKDNSVTITAGTTSLTCTISGNVDEVQVEEGSFSTSYIKTGVVAVTRAADNLTIDESILPDSFCLLGTWTPLGDGASYADNDVRLFGSQGTSEVQTIGLIAYNYTVLSGGGSLEIIKSDLNKLLQNKYAFQLFQDGSDVDAKIYMDGMQKLSETETQTLSHSNAGLEIGNWSGVVFASIIKDIGIYGKELSDLQLKSKTASIYLQDEGGAVISDENGNALIIS